MTIVIEVIDRVIRGSRWRATAEMSKWLNFSKTFGSLARPDFTNAIAASTVVTHIYARSCYDHHA
jgi:hypothetical protein